MKMICLKLLNTEKYTAHISITGTLLYIHSCKSMYPFCKLKTEKTKQFLLKRHAHWFLGCFFFLQILIVNNTLVRYYQ